MTVTLGECVLASVTILDLHLRFRMYHQINLFTVMFYDKRRKRQCIEQRSAASIRQYITYVVIINVVFYANSIRRSVMLANFATRSSTDSCCKMSFSTDANINYSNRSWCMVDLSLFFMYDSFENPRSTEAVVTGRDQWLQPTNDYSLCNFVQQT